MKCAWTFGGQCKKPVSDILVMHPDGAPEKVETVSYCLKHVHEFADGHSGWTILSRTGAVRNDKESEVW